MSPMARTWRVRSLRSLTSCASSLSIALRWSERVKTKPEYRAPGPDSRIKGRGQGRRFAPRFDDAEDVILQVGHQVFCPLMRIEIEPRRQALLAAEVEDDIAGA